MINPEEETTVNITLKVSNKHIVYLENFLKHNYTLISFEHLPNTEKMYQEDKEFKKLLKSHKESKRIKQDYISKNNHKYNG